MQCKCGQELKYATHIVKTTQGKAKWLKVAVTEDIEVSQWDCEACGRHMHQITSNNKIIESFG